MVELVLKPYIGLLGSSSFNYAEVARFASEHGLDALLEDNGTPIGKLANSGESDTDLLAEFAGRFCYRAWAKGRETDEYIANVLKEHHGNVIAHPTYHFIVTGVSRALTHELVRHHVGTNPSQESQRYVTADSGEIEVVGYKANRAVVPPMISHLSNIPGHEWVLPTFQDDYTLALSTYHQWLYVIKGQLEGTKLGPTLIKKRANEAARCFLPNASETRLLWTMNARAARWIIEQRGDTHADLEIRRLACAFTRQLKIVSPLIFYDTEVYMADDGFEAVKVEHSKV